MSRGFEVVNEENRKYPDEEIILPTRADSRSAGYDFYANEATILPAYGSYLFWTDVKAFMGSTEFLALFIRSSLGIQGFRLMNQTGIIDSSYYGNPKNDGNIGICIQNHSDETKIIARGERIAQGVFQNYLIASNDEVKNANREGGFGSSGK